jgi:tetratricopeptide (TPR) repeat protein
MRRGDAYLHADDPVGALQDIEAGLAAEPTSFVLLDMKGRALDALDRHDEALAIGRSLVADHPDSPRSMMLGVWLLNRLGANDEAKAAVDKVISLKPSSQALVARVFIQPFGNLEQGMADSAQALKIDSQGKPVPLYAMAALQYQAKHYAEAMKWGKQAAERDPKDMEVQVLLGQLQHALGQDAAATATFARVRQAAGSDGESLNRLCWSEATAGFDLPGALADCDAALQAEPKMPHIEDSRAFVLLRLGRDAEAMAQYDAAWEGRPAPAIAMFARAIAEKRTGRGESADRDRQAAIKKDKYVLDWFQLYGMTE